jgi:hypothetical protein
METPARPSRLQRARSQLRVARYTIAAVAVTGFAFFALIARAAHPGKSSSASSASTSTSTSDDQAAQSFDFGNGSISPSPNNAPSVQSGGS